MKTGDESSDWIGPVWVYLVALALFFLRFGYGYGLGDQDEILPYLMHLLDPSLLAKDWFVQTQSAAFSVRTYFVFGLVPFAHMMPIETAVLILYLVLWFLVAVGSFRLLRVFGLQRSAAAGGVILSLGLLHKWAIGSNDLVYSMLVPEMAAWALALPGIRYALLERRHLAAILLGVSAWFQILVGLLVFGVLFVEWIWSLVHSDTGVVDWRSLAKTLGIFLLAASPVIAPILVQQLQATSIEAEPSVFYILGPFRNPIHHMISSFPAKAIIRFSVILAGGAWSLRLLSRHGSVKHAGFLWRIGGLVLVGCLVMAVFTEWIPVLLVAKFQFYKLTVLLKLLALALICAFMASVLPAGVVRPVETLLKRGRPRLAAALSVLALFILIGVVKPDLVHSRLAGRLHVESALGQMELWIAENTDRSEVFAVPPSNSTFRTTARRAVVVNFMAFPYNDADMIEWYRRIQAMSPVGHVESGLNIRPELDGAFESLDADQLHELAREYGFTFVLRQRPIDGFRPIKTFGYWTLYGVI